MDLGRTQRPSLAPHTRTVQLRIPPTKTRKQPATCGFRPLTRTFPISRANGRGQALAWRYGPPLRPAVIYHVLTGHPLTEYVPGRHTAV